MNVTFYFHMAFSALKLCFWCAKFKATYGKILSFTRKKHNFKALLVPYEGRICYDHHNVTFKKLISSSSELLSNNTFFGRSVVKIKSPACSGGYISSYN